ncbi:hypothetical protein SAMD00019534_002010 [Acytostelium subglobosum LB1]|uniref:hypothetical protein n=1 Tax=Acytostelium subglobosum LB1 TaxID=1410327 RepID=UPI000644BF3A|nr:hypothetical protein SAMD00019534_002010 [Acytostelium subglobosum LB1]GAM17026.1 hypothetical protein SAMD00019534_002010 [Acytostelium subglobosum LB1]|eukprot:XP_012759088.1 hypothetical protein SAMD00019534_002010 [Acytostelium subglobosum LB1]
MLGYLAGLNFTRIGLVVPGPPTENYYTANAFFLGMQKANVASQVFVVSTSSYDDNDTATGAINILKSLNIDAVTQSQLSMAVSEHFLDSYSAKAFGSNGYPYESILGDTVIQSIVMNFHVIFKTVGNSIIDGTFTSNNYYLDFNTGFYTLDRYSFLVSDSYINLSQQVFNTLASQTDVDAHPYLCAAENVANYGSECITHHQMLSMKTLYSGVANQGFYAVPTTEVYDRQAINIAFIAVSSVQIFVAAIFVALCVVFANKLPILYSNLLFCFGLILGAVLVPVGIILYNTQLKTTGICVSRVWMISLGYNFLVGLMIIKNTRIYLKFKELLLKRSDVISPISPKTVYNWYGGLLLINVLLLALYTGLGGVSSYNSLGLDGIGRYEYTQNCVNNKRGDNLLYTLLVFHGLQLLYGCVMAWRTRVIDLEEFEETHEFNSCIYLISFTLFIVIPLMAGIESQRSRDAIISSMGIFTTFTTLIIIFGSKMWKVYKPVEDDGLPNVKMQQLPDRNRGKTSPYNHSTLTKSQFLTAVTNPTGSQSSYRPEHEMD